MLPAQARVRSRSDHRLVAARGRRARRGPVLVQLLTPEADAADAAVGDADAPVGRGDLVAAARAAVVVGKRVGPAVRRNLVKRRLREQLRPRLPMLPPGAMVVVRAQPSAAGATFDELGSALDRAIGAALGAGATRGAGARHGR